MVPRMYHDQYTRRRTADSFHEDEESSPSEGKTQDDWSWGLFIGLIIVQFSARSVWVSFGVISSFILGDSQHATDLFWTPAVFTGVWIASEPWLKRICDKIATSVELMYVVLVGLAASWCGLLIAVKCPLTLIHLVPLLGVLGGLGTSFATTAAQSLTEKHFPKRFGALRSLNQSVAALSLFITPGLSYFIVDNFGDHGGLLIHAGLLMQGMVGGMLLKSAQWPEEEQTEQCRRAFTYPEREHEVRSREGVAVNSEGDEEIRFWRNPATEVPILTPVQVPNVMEQNEMRQKPPRIRIFPVKVKRCNASGVEILPSISEVNESALSSGEAEHVINDLKRSIEELHRISCSIAEVHNVNTVRKPPRTFQYKANGPNCVSNPENVNCDERTSEQNVVNTQESEQVCSERVEYSDSYDSEGDSSELDSETGERNPTASLRLLDETPPIEDDGIEESNGALPNREQKVSYGRILGGMTLSARLRRLRSMACCFFFYVRYVFLNFSLSHSSFAHPLLLPTVLLLFSIHFTFVGLISLTPTLVGRYIEDSTKEESAFTVCLIGFTWLCFVISSPCFSTIHFTNHQIICILSLGPSALSCYMLSESTTQDEIALYSSLYGICHGITLMTSHSVLKLSFGGSTQLARMQPWFNTSTGVSMVLSVFFMSLVRWTADLRNCYKLFAVLLTLSMIVWAVQGCIVSVRARRGRHSITWSRRRRVS